MTSQDIKELLKFGERISLECREAKNEIPKSVWETYSAFANTCGGIIILGVIENLREPDILNEIMKGIIIVRKKK